MSSPTSTRRNFLAAFTCAASLGRGQTATPEDVVTGLDTPWSIGFLPDGRMLLTERPGRVSVIENGSRRTVGQINVNESGEGGLLGQAVDPEFSQNNGVYLYYTARGSNQISRFDLRNDSLEGETPILTGIPAARIHNGGRMRFGPDGLLYVATGDAAEPRLSQDRDSLAGKILRINRDGSEASGNPFGNRVFAVGIRNSQGFDWKPGTNDLYITDHGPNRRDAIYRVEAGGNYRWPRPCSDHDEALRCYTGMTLAPGGMAFHGDFAYIGGLRGSQLRRVRITDGQIGSEQALITNRGRLRDVVLHDGWLYVTTSNRDGRGRPRTGDDRVLRFRPADQAAS